MSQIAPQWSNIPGIIEDCDVSGKRKRRIKRKGMRKRITIAVAAIILGALTGTVITNAMDEEAAQAETMAEVRAYIRANGGIPPCIHEDGSGQPGKCFWDGPRRGNGTGASYVAVPTMPGHDKRIVILSKQP